MEDYKKIYVLEEAELHTIQGGGWFPWVFLGTLIGTGLAHVKSAPVPPKNCYDYHSAYPAPVFPCR